MRGRAGLLDRLGELERRDRTAQVRLALAEAEFRLAIDPATASGEAAERLRRSIAHDPFSAKARLHLGRVLHRDGRRWSALGAYREAHRLAPANPRVPLLAGLALLDLGKPEREIGAALLLALAAADPAAVTEAMADVDALLESRPGDHAPPGKRKKRSTVPDGAPVAVWRGLLQDQLARKTPTTSWVRSYLGAAPAAADGEVAEVCTAAVLLLAAGMEPADVRDAVRARVARDAGHPAVRMLTAVLGLVKHEDATFAAEAARLVGSRLVPVAVVCALQFMRSDPDRVDAITAVRHLDRYPAELREHACLRELRIAVLDAHARRAWSLDRFDEAAVLWRATVAIDPYRPAVAVNVALIATRTRSAGYAEAWEHAAELPYLHAAALAEPTHLADDRVALHRALAEQALRHSGSLDPTGADIASWVADGDAVETWLSHWDLYYVNARLRFRSPVHLLGAASDADPDALTEARDILLRHLDGSIGTKDWAGASQFCEYARERVTRAWRHAADVPGADQHREAEQKAADALLDEAKRRVLTLHHLSIALRQGTSARHRRLLCSIARHEFLLPIGRLHARCVEQGTLDGKVHLAEILDLAAAQFAGGWDSTAPADPRDTRRMLADLEVVRAAAPGFAGIHVPYVRLLTWSDRAAEAYAAAVTALDLAGDPTDRTVDEDVLDRRSRICDLLTVLVDDIARTDLDRELPGADDALVVYRRAMTRHAISVVPVIAVADRLAGTGKAANIQRAEQILSDRLGVARSERQRTWLRRELRRLRGLRREGRP
jgi:hypothetical protein